MAGEIGSAVRILRPIIALSALEWLCLARTSSRPYLACPGEALSGPWSGSLPFARSTTYHLTSVTFEVFDVV
jgi:hypothetical protein